MRIQWEILLGILILNLSTGLVVALQLPGTANASTLTAMNGTQYETHFNNTALAKGWDSTPFSGIPIIGDIFYGFNAFWQMFHYVFDGFPTFLNWIRDSYIADQGARDAFTAIAVVLSSLFYILFAVFIIEFISGRFTSD